MLSTHKPVTLDQTQTNYMNFSESGGAQDWKPKSPLSQSKSSSKKLSALKTHKLSQKNSKGNSRRSGQKEGDKQKSPELSKFGVSIKPNDVVWQKWSPGVEYKKDLTIKNVGWKNIKLRFNQAKSPIFQFIHPQPIFISPGTSFTLPIVFRPTKKIVYKDTIEFFSVDEVSRFSVPVRAVISEPEVCLSQKLSFGPVGVNDSKQLTLVIENHSLEKQSFSWKVPAPYCIIPPSGEIPGKSAAELRAVFCPTEAKSFEAAAVCDFGQFNRSTILYGIGKFSQISVTPYDDEEAPCQLDDGIQIAAVLNFTDVCVHTTAHSYLKLTNFTHVKSFFSIRRRENKSSGTSPFFCATNSAQIDPQSHYKLGITYRPTDVGKQSIDYFELTTHGTETTTIIKVLGNSVGAQVRLSSQFLDFSVGAARYSKTIVVKITNDCDCPATFQFPLAQDSGVFRCEPNAGVVPAGQYLEVKFKFVPTETIIYYRRIPFHVFEMDPLFIDMLGTCHNELVKPPVLEHYHLQRDLIHQFRGLTFLPPDILQDQYKMNKLYRDDDGYLYIPDDRVETENFLYKSSFDEFFDDGHHTLVTPRPPHVSLDKTEVWFGQTQHGLDKPRHVTLTLTNHTRGKINVTWINDADSPFEVTPSSCQIPPRKTSDFRLNFRPGLPNQLYKCHLECYVNYWCMRDYRLVHEDFYVMPWFVGVTAVGHTFDARNDSFPPRIRVSSSKLNFPPVLTRGVSYKTLLLEQTDQLPMLFNFDQDERLEHFCVKPRLGVVDSKYQIVTMRYSPDRPEINKEPLLLRINDNRKYDKQIELFGSMERPDILLSNKRELYFRPTHLRTTSTAHYQIQNVGRSIVRFRWVVSGDDTKCVTVAPRCGIIQPNEISSQLWSFRPLDSDKRLHHAFLLAWIADPHAAHTDDSAYQASTATRYKLRVIGEGLQSEIKAQETSVDFGTIVVGSRKSETITLYNESHCDAKFKLSVEQCINKDCARAKKDPLCLQVSSWSGVVSARGKLDLLAHASPHRRVLYAWSLYCELLDENDRSCNPNSRLLLAEFSAEGVFPTASVIDVRSFGSAANISKTQMWRWLNLDHLNLCLDSDPEKSELVYSAATRLSVSRRPSLLTDSVLDFNFGAAPVGVEDTEIEIILKNIGFVTLKWDFLLPKDVQISVDFWADSGEFSASELHELFVQDNKLFKITPQRGELRPGEITTVVLTYKHNVAGTHRLPVLFKIDKGKEVMLNLVGVTVEKTRRYLHYVANKHTFTPVPIGSSNALVQLYELFNGGSTPIIYQVGLDSIKELRETNFDRPILQCLNPQGEIAPCSTASIEWVFTPIEARSYTVDVPIHILGGDTAVISFVGIGYDSRKLQPSMLMIDQASDFPTLPIPQQIPIKGQCLQFSEERISFGNLPLYGRARRLVFVTNKSPDRPVTYSWHASSSVVNRVLSISPAKGVVEPGESVVTKIVFSATGRPSFYNLDLVCEVYDELEQAEYRAELKEWEAERERRRDNFIIGEDGVVRDHNRIHDGLTVTCLAPDLNSNNNKQPEYLTLPAIVYEKPVVLPPTSARKPAGAGLVDTSDVWLRPQPPRLQIFHLGVTARTHDIFEYRTYFAEHSQKQFVDRTLQIEKPVNATIDEEDEEEREKKILVVSEKEKDGLVTILSGLLRGILEDPSAIESFKETADEQIPLFNNFRTTVPSAHQNRSFYQNGQSKDEKPASPTSPAASGTSPTSGGKVPSAKQSDKTASTESKRGTGGSSSSGGGGGSSKKDKPAKLSGKAKNGKASKGSKKDKKGDDAAPAAATDAKSDSVATPAKNQDGVEVNYVTEAPSTRLMNALLTTESQDHNSSANSERFNRMMEECWKNAADRERASEPRQDLLCDVIKTLPEFGSLIEDVFANTVCNIMEEALHGEVLLTARPRVVALPPCYPRDQANLSARPNSSRGGVGEGNRFSDGAARGNHSVPRTPSKMKQ